MYLYFRFHPSLFKQLTSTYDLSGKDAIIWGITNEEVAVQKYCSYSDAVVEPTGKEFNTVISDKLSYEHGNCCRANSTSHCINTHEIISLKYHVNTTF